MTRKLISLFLALCLVLGLFPMTALAVEDSGHDDHCVCAGTLDEKEDHTCDTTTSGWTAITSVDALRAALQNGGKYYLATDIAMPDYVAGPPAQNYGAITIPEGKTVTLCLNDMCWN